MSYNAPAEDILRSLGQVVRIRRLELQQSQETLAFRAHLHRTHITAIENGRHSISLRKLVLLADALELDVLELLQRAVSALPEPGVTPVQQAGE